MCTQRRLRSTWASEHPDLWLLCLLLSACLKAVECRPVLQYRTDIIKCFRLTLLNILNVKKLKNVSPVSKYGATWEYWDHASYVKIEFHSKLSGSIWDVEYFIITYEQTQLNRVSIFWFGFGIDFQRLPISECFGCLQCVQRKRWSDSEDT